MADPGTDDHRVPTLAMVGPNEANNVLGHVNYIGMDEPSGGPAPKDNPRPVLQDFAVATGGIYDAENQLIWGGSYQVSQYEAFKQKVLDEEKWVFLVSDPHDIEPYYHRYKEPPPGKAGFVFGGGQAPGYYADYTDPNPDQTAKTIDDQHVLLRAVGDSIEAIGHFTATLNNAAQLYALADENSNPPLNSTV